MVWASETSKPTLNDILPSNPFQIILPTEDPAFKYGGPNSTQTLGAIIKQTTTVFYFSVRLSTNLIGLSIKIILG